MGSSLLYIHVLTRESSFSLLRNATECKTNALRTS